MRRGATAVVFLASLWFAVGTAAAGVKRFALIVGNDRGDADEAVLQFAEEDARRMHEVLRRYGEVLPERAFLLTGEDAATVRRRLISLNEVLRQEASDPTTDTMLFVFYSGHADAESLHLSGTQLAWEELKGLVVGSPARMRVLVLDACQSGTITEVKGSRPGEPFPLEIEQRLMGEGVAFISSSTASELSQESPELQGSFFAHYFMVALRGVGDASGDGRVTLGEAFAYASQRTKRATSRTTVGTQHPTYWYDIHGQADITITDLTVDAEHRATLEFEDPGEYLVFRAAADGPLVAEVITGHPGRRLVLPPGRYLVRLRTPAYLREQTLYAEAGETTLVRPAEMASVAYRRLMPKGVFSRGTRHGPIATLHYRGETLHSLGGMFMGGGGDPVLLGGLWLQPRVLVGGSSFRAGDISLRQIEVDVELLLSYGFDLSAVILLLGGGVGGMYLRQEASGAEGLDDRSSGGFVFSAHADVIVPIDNGVYIRVGAEALGVALRSVDDAGDRWKVMPTFRVGLGLGYSL